MREHQSAYPVKISCKTLGVSRSGYYRWVSSPTSEREINNLVLIRRIEDIHRASKKTYGSPRIHAQLQALGWDCGRGRVERLMRRHGIRSKVKRRFRLTTNSEHNERIAPDLLHRCFSVTEPNRVWASDVTYLWTNEGWLYLAVTLDLFSRKVVGWSMASRLTSELAMNALNSALVARQIKPGLIHHSDRGREYASYPFRALLKSHGISQSMSRRADCWDNAVVESFFHTLKTEFVHHERFQTRSEARQKVFEWIEIYYNRQRLHSTLGFTPPAEYEKQTHVA